MKKRKMQIVILSVSIRIVLVIAAFFVIMQWGMNAYRFGYAIFNEQPVSQEPGEKVSVTITKSMSEKDVSSELEQKGLIRDALLFYVQIQLSPHRGALKQGTYLLNTAMTSDEMINILAGSQPEEENKGDQAK